VMSSRPRKASERLYKARCGSYPVLSRRFGTAEAGAPLLNRGLLRQCGLQPVLVKGINDLGPRHVDARSADYDAGRAAEGIDG
jgi:hypothetical protein